MPTTRDRWGFKVICILFFKKARDEKQRSPEHEVWPSANLRYSRKECQNLKCMNYLPNACQWIEIKWWFHGNVEIFFHTSVQHTLFNIKLPMVKQRVNYKIWFTIPQNLWFTIPCLQNFQVFGKTFLTLKLQPILWIYNAHDIKQGIMREVVVQLIDQLGSYTCQPISAS
jgi:hypothetical protein